MQKGMEIKKNKHFEHIRAFSVLAVITIHTMYSALLQFGEGALVAEKILYRCVMNMMWWAVPCFLMMTGSLLLDSNRKVPLKKLYRKYILRMLLVIQSIGLFVLFNSMNIENKLDQVLSEIGEKSFGIYLIHMVIINLAYKLFKFNPFTVSFAMGGMILVIVNLALSYMMVTIMKYLPGIKKII